MLDIRFADAAALADPARFFEVWAGVPAARRAKADRLRPLAAKQRSLCAGALLADMLRSHGVTDAEMDFAEDEYGKPFLPRRPDVHFSLSHSGTQAMCAVADRPVGCDVQLAAPRTLRLAERFFSAEEQRIIFAQRGEAAQQAMFCRIWTLKESFVKCVGLGLRLPLDAFDLFPDGTEIVLRQRYDDGRYTFTEPDAGADYRAAFGLRVE